MAVVPTTLDPASGKVSRLLVLDDVAEDRAEKAGDILAGPGAASRSAA